MIVFLHSLSLCVVGEVLSPLWCIICYIEEPFTPLPTRCPRSMKKLQKVFFYDWDESKNRLNTEIKTAVKHPGTRKISMWWQNKSQTIIYVLKDCWRWGFCIFIFICCGAGEGLGGSKKAKKDPLCNDPPLRPPNQNCLELIFMCVTATNFSLGYNKVDLNWTFEINSTKFMIQ